MKRRNLDAPWVRAATPVADVAPIILEQELIPSPAARRLSSRVRQLSKGNQGISRWIALAVVAGGAVALAFVQLVVR
jgi:hypothetical protein